MRSCAACVLALASCLDPTEVMVTITTDVPCAQLKGTNIRVGSGDVSASVSPAEAQCTSDGTIGSVVVLPNASLSRTQIKVVTGTDATADQCDSDPKAKGCITARRSLSFVSHSSLSLPIMMQMSCVNVLCDEQTTCVNGQCEPIDHIDFDASAPDASAPDASEPDASVTSVMWVATSAYSGTTTTFPPVTLPGPAAVGDTYVAAFLTQYPVGMLTPPKWTLEAQASDDTTETVYVFTHTMQATDPMKVAFATDSPAASKTLDAVLSQYRYVSSVTPGSGGVSVAPTAQIQTVPSGTVGAMWLGIFGSMTATSFIQDSRATPRKAAQSLFQEDEQVTKNGVTDALTASTNGNSVVTLGLLLSP